MSATNSTQPHQMRWDACADAIWRFFVRAQRSRWYTRMGLHTRLLGAARGLQLVALFLHNTAITGRTTFAQRLPGAGH
jgi:hypothetical protein